MGLVDVTKERIECADDVTAKSGAMVPNIVSEKANGVAMDVANSSLGMSDDGLITYTRRKNAKIEDFGKIWSDSYIHKSMNHIFDQVGCFQKYSYETASDNCSQKHQTGIVLEQIYQSLEGDDGLKRNIQDAIVFHTSGIDCISSFKKSTQSRENGGKYILQTLHICDHLQNEASASHIIPSNGSVNALDHHSINELCRSTLFEIIASEKFSQLCSLLLENFQGMKTEKLLDLSRINSRMKEKAYEISPMLFHSDMQQVWTRLQNVGSELLALAKCLSEKTMASFREQTGISAHNLSDVRHEVGSSAHNISKGGKHEPVAQEHDTRIKQWRTMAHNLDEAHTCKRCGEKADGRNGLVCDSCEEIYHISCVEPPVKEIPVKSWYCANCTSMGIESPHDNCVACERLNASFDGNGEEEFLYEETPEALEESSAELVANETNKRFTQCKVCRTVIKRIEDYRICSHPFCPHKFYHTKCLTSKQLISYGPCWYCPSCLCRTCFTDQDDDKIVLCDGCDHAYHTYCMNPPRTDIPRGKWFCKKCNAGIQRVRKAKRLHQNLQNNTKKRALDGKLKGDATSQKSGGVDMLLNAAKTLNYEENLVAMGLNAK